VDMFTTPLPCLKMFARDTVLSRGHTIDLHTLTYLPLYFCNPFIFNL
jgi:hypothetical protein